MYEVELSSEAQRFLKSCDAPLARKLARCFEAMRRNPLAGNNVKALKGPLTGAYRYRIGDHRVVYTVNEQIVTVFVITIVHRGDAYR